MIAAPQKMLMKNKMLSVILCSYYSKERINTCYQRLSEALNGAGIPFELVVMDDGSQDNSYEIALALEAAQLNVRAYQLSRNYTSHYSIFAGLSMCRGGCAIAIPDDEQQPYDTLVEMYRLWEDGEKIIIPHRIQREDPAISKAFSRLFYGLMNRLSDVSFPPGGADTFFIDREVIDIINTRIHPVNTSTISEILRLGFSPCFLPYHRPQSVRATKSRWTFKKKWRLAKDFFFSSSSFPIRFITRCGLFFSFVSLLMVIAFIAIKLLSMEQDFYLFNVNVQGWTSLIIAITFFSGLILFSLGILSEYVFRIYEEVKARPGYIIKQKDSET